jgi:hypothetical protein
MKKISITIMLAIATTACGYSSAGNELEGQPEVTP